MSSPEDDKNSTFSGFGVTLVFNAAICGAILIAFSYIRTSDRNIYEPKTYMPSEEKRPPRPPRGLFDWVFATWKTPDDVLLKVAGLDAYMFIKFLRTALYLFLGITVLTFCILVPINVVEKKQNDPNANLSDLGMKVLTLSDDDYFNYQWAHVACTIAFSIAVIILLYMSVREYADLRHKCLLEEEHRNSAKARTLLVTSIPSKFNERKKLYNLFNIFPDGVKHININRTVTPLADLVEERDNLHYKLEQVITKWIALNVKQSGKAEGGTYKAPPRPSHKTGFLGLFGKKVDTIEYYLANIVDRNRKIKQARENKDRFPVQESAFILFNSQVGAHVAAQTLVSNHTVHMEPRYIETNPDDVVWGNLDFSPFQLMIRKYIGTTIAIVIAITWFTPVAIVSGLSKLEEIEKAVPEIGKILPSNSVLRGIIQGLLPPVLMSILTAMVPIIYTLLSKFEGHPRTGDIQLSVMTKYFWFLIFTVLLASSLSGVITGSTSAFKDFQDVSYLFKVFATKLPPASDFFITYVLLKALSTSSQEILQAVNLVKRRVLIWLLVSSPRKHLQVIDMSPITWGVFWPEHTIVFAIGFLYAVIAPFSNLFITLYFFMFYIIYRYQMLYVYQTEKDQSLGAFFMKAVSQIYVGVYISQITFAGLMLAQTDKGIAKLVVTVVLIIVTAFSHIFLIQKYKKMVSFIPVQKYLDAEQQHLSPNQSSFAIKRMPEANDYQSSSFSFESSSPLGGGPPSERSLLKSYFNHPALSDPQPILWTPLDSEGFGATEQSQISSRNSEFLEVTSHGATMDSQGRIQLSQYSFPEDTQGKVFLQPDEM